MFRGKLSYAMWWIVGQARICFCSAFSISFVFSFKQNPMPQFPHLSNQIYGLVCPCYSALELSP